MRMGVAILLDSSFFGLGRNIDIFARFDWDFTRFRTIVFLKYCVSMGNAGCLHLLPMCSMFNYYAAIWCIDSVIHGKPFETVKMNRLTSQMGKRRKPKRKFKSISAHHSHTHARTKHNHRVNNTHSIFPV